jgi:hypothetical protein
MSRRPGHLLRCGQFENGRGHRTQGGRFICLTDFAGEKVTCFFLRESKAIQRGTSWSFSADTSSAVDVHSTGVSLLAPWEDLTGVCVGGSNYLLNHNRGLQNVMVKTKLPVERRLRGDLGGLRHGPRRGEYKRKSASDGSMMADPLTRGDVYITPFERLKTKKNLVLLLRHDNTFIKKVTTTVQREDVSRC